MALSDEELLDFDESQLAHFDRQEALRALDEHGAAFRYQLVTARHLEGWAERLGEGGGIASNAAAADAAFGRALREIAAHLRQGDYLPGGVLYVETAG
jgi:hypothetical protein